jgi:hypothetical protein
MTAASHICKLGHEQTSVTDGETGDTCHLGAKVAKCKTRTKAEKYSSSNAECRDSDRNDDEVKGGMGAKIRA